MHTKFIHYAFDTIGVEENGGLLSNIPESGGKLWYMLQRVIECCEKWLKMIRNGKKLGNVHTSNSNISGTRRATVNFF